MRHLNYILTMLVAATASIGDGYAQSVRTHALVDSVFIGERFEFAIAVDRPRQFDIVLPDLIPGATAIGDIEILSEKSRRTYQPSGRQIDSLVFAVTTFAIDEARIPPVNVMFVSATDTVFAASAPAVLPVRSVVPEEADRIEDIAPLAQFPGPWLLWILLAGIVIGAVVIAYMLFKKYGRRGPKSVQQDYQPAPSRQTPYDQAQTRLAELSRMFPLSEPDFKPFFVELSDLLRTYMCRTTGIPALEMTSSELVRALGRTEARGRHEIGQNNLDLLNQVLNVADFVKFADGKPDERTVWIAFESTSRLIDNMEHLYNPPRLPIDREMLQESGNAPT